MALVGDIIMEMRALGPDVPQVAPAPPTPTPSSVVGGTLPNGIYFLQACLLYSWGVTLPSTEVTINSTNGAIQLVFASAPPTGYTGIRVFFTVSGGATGTESMFQDTLGTNILTALVTALGPPGTPPVRSSAYSPDTDGGAISAFVAYRWLNEALKKAALLTGGIQDWGGAASIANQPNYRPAVGVWRKFDAVWYDGWELEQGNKADIFRNRPLTASISRIFALDVNSAQQVAELYYIPSRSAASTTTNATLNSTDTVVTLTSAAGFTGPPFGLVLIGTEVCFYATVSGSTLTGLTRGLSGTITPTTLASGATVKELNILWNGFRMPVVYSPGQSALTLDVPQGWEAILPKYLLSKFRDFEQSRQEAASLMKEFDADFMALAKSNRQLAGPRQARIYDSFGFRGVIPAGAGGGLIIR